MAIDDVVFRYTSGSAMYDPVEVQTTETMQIHNLGTEILSGLGLYVAPATVIGSMNYPSEFSPATDYQDLIDWGQATDDLVTAAGGLLVTVPGPTDYYVTRTQGSLLSNKIPLPDIPAGSYIEVILELQAPTGTVVARRIYVELRVE